MEICRYSFILILRSRKQPAVKTMEEIMSDFTESKTYANLAYAFAGESQARNKYTYFAGAARHSPHPPARQSGAVGP